MKTEFNKKQFESIYPDGKDNFYWDVARNKIIEDQLIRNNCDDKKILEIGCGRGFIVKYLRRNGFDCWGAELAKNSVLPEVKKFVKDNTNALELDEEEILSFEVILLLDVIEHIEKPEKFIKTILDKYTNVQDIIITVPARSELWSNYDKFNGHFMRYELKNINKLAKKIKFKLIQNRYFFLLLYFPAFIFSKGKMIRQVEVKAPKGIGITLHRVIAYLLYAEYKLFNNKIFGSSIIAVLKK